MRKEFLSKFQKVENILQKKKALKESYKDFDSKSIANIAVGLKNLDYSDCEQAIDVTDKISDYLRENLGIEITFQDAWVDNSNWVNPDIKQASLTEDGITVEVSFEDIRENFIEEAYDAAISQFAKNLAIALVHELVHMHQWSKYFDRGKAPLNDYDDLSDYKTQLKYLSSKDELSAHAIAAVEEARSIGYRDRDILEKLKSSDNDLLIELDSVQGYVNLYNDTLTKKLKREMANFILQNMDID